MRTAIYRRISTDQQDTKSQTRAIFDWMRTGGLTRHDALWFTDRGVSSARTSRPAFDRMMAAIREGKVDRLVVYKLDRIGRWDSDDFLTWRIALKRARVELVSLTESGTGFESIADKIIAIVTAEADRLWLEGHKKRVTAGIRAKRRAGAPWGAGIWRAKLTQSQWKALARRKAAGTSVTALAAEVGLNRSHVSRTLNRLAKVQPLPP